MSRLPLQLAVVCLCALSPASVGVLHAAPANPSKHVGKKDAREQIADLEQQWRAATLSSDVPALDKLLAEDYVGISWTGQVNTKASQLDRLRNKTLVITRIDLTNVKVKVVGAVAIVTSHSELEGSNDGVELRGSFIYTRIYQRNPAGTWKITNFEATRVPPPGSRNGRHGDGPPHAEHP